MTHKRVLISRLGRAGESEDEAKGGGASHCPSLHRCPIAMEMPNGTRGEKGEKKGGGRTREGRKEGGGFRSD